MFRKYYRVAIGMLLAVFMVFGGAISPLSGAFDVFAVDNGKWIYVDGQKGNDDNIGTSADKPVKTWKEAKNKLGCEEGGIYVVGTVQAEGFITTKMPDKQVVKRTSDIVMFNVASEASFANIVVDGGSSVGNFNSPAIKPAENAKLDFLKGSKFQNIGYVENASRNEEKAGAGMGQPDNEIGGMVCLVVEGVKILVDGAEFSNNNGKGIFFAPLKGFEFGPSAVSLTMKSGTVTGNKGYFYHNECTLEDNMIYIYNALIKNNDASHMGDRYTAYKNRSGAVYVCNVGKVNLRSTDGAAVFGNTEHDIIYLQGYEENVEGRSNTMLGGGNPNWQHSTVDNSAYVPGEGIREKHYDVYDASPSDGDKSAAESAATSIIKNNSSTVIDSNGAVNFGKGDEKVPETPEVPADEQGCDDTPTPTPENQTVKIKKTDMGGTEIAGADIVVKDSNNNEVAAWTSTKDIHEIKVKPGDYTLEEVNAPEGYQKVETKIAFTVANDGKVTVKTTEVKPAGGCEVVDGVLVLKDKAVDTPTPTPENQTVKIKKTDMGGTEIAGADIVVKDSNNNEVAAWTSTKDIHEIKVKPGDYTLEEVNAPEGYQKVETKIAFTVANDGKVTVKTTEVKPAGGCEVVDGVLVLKDEVADTQPTSEIKLTTNVKNQYISPAKDQTIIDIVKAEGLEEGKEYTLKGEIRKADGSENGTVISSSNAPCPITSDVDQAEMTFSKIDASSLKAGDKLVVFEYLYEGDDEATKDFKPGDDNEIAKHADIDSPAQTTMIVDGQIKISKKADVETVEAGKDVPYTITVTNERNVPAVVDVVDTPEAGLIYKEADNDASYDSDEKTVIWEDLKVPANGTITLSIVFTVSKDASGKLKNRAKVNEPDNPGNVLGINEDDDDVKVLGVYDEENDDNPKNKAKTKGANTGDDAPMAGAILALLAAAGAFEVMRRRRMN